MPLFRGIYLGKTLHMVTYHFNFTRGTICVNSHVGKQESSSVNSVFIYYIFIIASLQEIQNN